MIVNDMARETNIIARVLLNDDAEQAATAAALLREGPLFVPLTVMLELEWVLRGVAGLSRETIQRMRCERSSASRAW